MNRRLRGLLAAVLALALAIGLAGMVRHRLDAEASAQDHYDARQRAGLSRQAAEKNAHTAPNHEASSPGEDSSSALAEIDLAALREVNPDVVGWIAIPGTVLSYPLLQAADNDYYLDHTWKKSGSSMGSVFLECENSPDFSDFNTIVYAHNLRSGAMFGSLKRYKDPDDWAEHPSVYIVSDDGVSQYDIFAAFEVGVEEITYGLEITESSIKRDFIHFSLDRSVIDTGIVPTESDRILTLSTCTGDGYATRWVVQAVLKENICS